MVVVKVKRDTAGEENYLKNACNYVADERTIEVDGYGVSPDNAKDAYEQMMAVKRYYSKTSGNPLLHVVVSYDNSVKSAEKACELSRKCAEYYNSDFQTLCSTHEKDRGCSNYHSHLLINSVNYNNGIMINSSVENMNHFCEHVADITIKNQIVL